MSKKKEITWSRFYEFVNYNTRGDPSTVSPTVHQPTFEEAQIMADEILRLRTELHRKSYEALEAHHQMDTALGASPFTGSYGNTKLPGLKY